nr:nucleic acid-binding, OB-fold protein [Tanacetum cinerariifolium]
MNGTKIYKEKRCKTDSLWPFSIKLTHRTISESDLPQRPLSIASVVNDGGITKNVQHADKNSKKNIRYQNVNIMDHKRLKFTATTPITCFSDQAHTLTRNVNEVVAELKDKNPFALPLCLQQLQGTTHIFQFHFDTMSSSRRPDFVLDKVFPTPTLALPQPEPIHTPEPDTTSTYQQTPQQSPTVEEIKQTYEEHYNKELKQSDDSEETVFAHSSEPQITTP